MSERLRGTWFVVPTPFDADGGLDLEGQRRVVEAAISWGVDGLTLMGVTSEAPALSDEERDAALATAVEAAGGRVPMVVGCSAASVDIAVERCRRARELGATAAMVTAPPLLGDADAFPRFLEEVAVRGGLPIVVQDEPVATGVRLAVSVLVRAVDATGARTVKLEDPPTPRKISRLLAERPDLDVFGGLGGVSALWELRRGACGTMTGFAFPEVLAEVRRATEAGEHRRAAEVFDGYLPLIVFEAQPGIGLAIRKELLRRRGALTNAVTRGAVRTVDERTARDLDDLLERMDLDPVRGPQL
ncbi:MAG TPA: dihydrodipicolinate synthase family protein [Actinomycetota bacterium]|nr:dihydrodipicolinate synthase family protein [Actinomycetota bacterium]